MTATTTLPILRTTTVPSAMRLLWGIGTADWTQGRHSDDSLDGTVNDPDTVIATDLADVHTYVVAHLPHALIDALSHAGLDTTALSAALDGGRRHRVGPRPLHEIRAILNRAENLPWSIEGSVELTGAGQVVAAEGVLRVVDADGDLIAHVPVSSLGGVGVAKVIAEGPTVIAAIIRHITGAH